MKQIITTDDEVATGLEAALLNLELQQAIIDDEIALHKKTLAERLKQLEKQSGKKVATKHFSVTRSLVVHTRRLDAMRVKRILSPEKYLSCMLHKTTTAPPVACRLSKKERLKDAK